MSSSSWSAMSSRAARRKHLSRRMRVEQLESRNLLAVLTWEGGAGTNWNDNIAGNTNWSGDVLPTDGDTLIFAAAAPGTLNNDTAAGNSYTLQFTGTGFTITGNAITLDNPGDDVTNSGATNTINAALNLVTDSIFNITAGTLTSGGQLSGVTGGLTKNGGGTLTISGNNTYDGLTSINGGTLVVTSATALGSTVGETIVTGTAAGTNLQLNPAAGINVAENLTLSSVAAGRASLVNQAQANTWSGNVVANSNTTGIHVQFTNTAGTLNISGDVSGTLTGTANLLIRGAAGSGTISGNVALNGTMNKTDDNSWTIGAAGKTYAWTSTILSRGTLAIGADNAIPIAVPFTIGQDTAAATLNLNGFNQTLPSITVVSTGTRTITNSAATDKTLTINNTVASTFSGVITGNVALVKLGTGTLTLSGTAANTYDGGTTVQEGTLILSKTAGLSAVGTGALVARTFTTVPAPQLTAIIQLGANEQIPNTTPITIDAAVGSGAATLNLNGFTETIGPTTLRAFTSVIGGGQLVTGTGTAILNGDLTLNNDRLATNTGAEVLITGNLDLGGVMRNIIVDGVGNAVADATIRANISNGGIVKKGSKNLILDPATANTYALGTSIDVTGETTGGVVANKNTAFGTGPVTVPTIGPGAGAQVFLNVGVNIANTLNIQGGSIAGVGALHARGNATWSGPINITAGTAAGGHFASAAGTTLTLSGPITSSVPVSFRNGTIIVSNTANSFTAASLNEGILRLGATNALPTNATLSIATSAAATFDLNDFDQTLNGISGGANAVIDTMAANSISTLNVGGGNANSTFSGAIRNSGAGAILHLTKSGTGTLTLPSPNTYLGTTRIENGVIRISHASSLGDDDVGTVIAGGSANSGRLELVGNVEISEPITLEARQGASADAAHITNVSGNNKLTGAITGAMGGSEYSIVSDAGSLTLAGTINNTNAPDRNLRLRGAGLGFVTGAITGTWNLVKQEAGTWFLTGANTYAGRTTIDAGSLRIGNAPTSTITVLESGFETPVLAANTFDYNPNDPTPGLSAWTYTGGSGIAKNGSPFNNANAPEGTQVALIQNANAIRQNITIPVEGDYIINFRTAARNNAAGGVPFEVVIGGQTVIPTYLPLAKTSYEFASSAVVHLTAGAHQLEFEGLPNAAPDLTSFIDGVTITQLVNTTAGNTNVIPDTSVVTINGGSLDLANNNETIGPLAGAAGGQVLLGSGNLTVNSTAGSDYRGTIAGTGKLIKVGSELLDLGGNSTFSGGTDVNIGKIRMFHASALGTGTINVAAGNFVMLWFNTGSNTVTNNWILNGLTTIDDGGGVKTAIYADGGAGGYPLYVLSGNIQLAATSSLGGHVINNMAVTGQISGAGGLTKGGARTDEASMLILTNPANNYAGATTIVQGSLVTGADEVIPNTSPVTVLGGRSLNLQTFTETVPSLAGTGSVTRVQLPIIFTSDATSGVSAAKTYTHKLDFIADGSAAFINGVVFDAVGLSGTGFTLTGPNLTIPEGAGTPVPPGLDPLGMGKLFSDFHYNGNPAVLSLSNLVAGTTYEIRLYNRLWTVFDRTNSITFDEDGAGALGSTVSFNPDAVPASILAYRYTAVSNGAGGALPLTVTFTQTAGGTFHFYGLSNEVAPALGSLIVGDANNATFDGVISGNGHLVKQGTGTLTLTGANTYPGATTVLAGTLSINQVGPGSNNANINNGAGNPNSQLITSALNVSANATVILNTGSNFSSANTGTTLTGAGTIRLASGTWWLGNAGGVGGGTNIAMSPGGLLDIQAGKLTNDYANANWSANQGSLNVASGAQFDLRNNNARANALTGGGAIFDAGFTNSLTIGVANGSGTFTGTLGVGGTTMSLTKTGTGTQTLSGTVSNTYTGNTIVDNGILILEKTGGAVAISGPVQMGNGNANQAQLNTQAANQFGPGVVMSLGAGTNPHARFSLQGNDQTLAGIVSPTSFLVIQNERLQSGLGSPGGTTQAATLTLNGAGNYVFAGGFLRDEDDGGTGFKLNLVKSGSGTQTLSGASVNYTGTTSVNAGTLVLQDTTAFRSPINVAATGTLNAIRTAAGIANRSPIMGNAITGSGIININNAGSGLAGGWTTVNGGTGSLNFSGTININSGVFARDNVAANTITGTATVNVAAGAVFGAGRGGNSTIGALNGTGEVSTVWASASAGSITIGNGGGSGTFTGSIRGNGSSATDGNIEGGVLSLIKTGAGTQTLTGNNTYSGPTTVGGGVLRVNSAAGSATGTSAVTVQSGATLEGENSIAGNVTVLSGGTLSPGLGGDDIGTLVVGGNLDLQAGSTYKADVNGAVSDQVRTTGSFTTNATLTGEVVNPTQLVRYVIGDNRSAGAIGGAFVNPLPLVFDGRNAVLLYNHIATPSLANDIAIVFNEAPVLPPPPLAPVSVPEGTNATKIGTYFDPDAGEQITFTATVGTVDKDVPTIGSWTWSIPTTDGPAGPFPVVITATDSLGVQTTTNFTYSVTNAKPAAQHIRTLVNGVPVTGSTVSVVPGALLTFEVAATDPSSPNTADAPFNFSLDWDDPALNSTGTTASEGTTLALSHVYTGFGTFHPTVVVTDTEPGFALTSDILQLPTIISTQQILLDGVLYVSGTDSSDRIIVQPGPGGAQISYNKQILKNFGGSITKIVVYGNGGGDNITVANVAFPVEFYGGAGNDYLAGGGARDLLDGGDDADRVLGGGGDDVLFGGGGSDTLSGGTGVDYLGGDDMVDVDNGDSVDFAQLPEPVFVSISPLAGRDTLNGDAGNDSLDGGPDSDRVNGVAGNDLVRGGDGNDTVDGGVGDDILLGDGGGDTMYGRAGRDVIIGGDGNDTILGYTGADLIYGGDIDATLADDETALFALASLWLSDQQAASDDLEAAAVDDELIDILSGEADGDWYLAYLSTGDKLKVSTESKLPNKVNDLSP